MQSWEVWGTMYVEMLTKSQEERDSGVFKLRSPLSQGFATESASPPLTQTQEEEQQSQLVAEYENDDYEDIQNYMQKKQ